MDEEFDLRPYINTLLHSWMWLIGASVFMAIVALIGTRFIPAKYEATAMLLVNDKEDLLQFDPRIISEVDIPLRDAYPELAKSDAVLLGLQNRPSLSNYSFGQLQDVLNVQPGQDPRLLQMTVTAENPEAAAEIANLWATELIEWANILHSTQGSESLTFYESELATSKIELQEAESDLIEFQALNRTAVISKTLEAHFETQSQHLFQLADMHLLTEDIAGMQQLLNNGPDDAPIPLSTELTLISLQSKVFDTTQNPLILQLTLGERQSEISRSDQLILLNQLEEILTTQINTLEHNLAELEPEILALQQEMQEAIVEYEQLSSNILIAKENYISLARKVSEERIAVQDIAPPLTLVSEATPPDEPVTQNTLMITFVAALLGFSMVAAYLVLRQWWQSTPSTA